MKQYMTQSKAKQSLAAGQTHEDLIPGTGVLTVPTHEQIAMRAYDIYVQTGCLKGRCQDNWNQAVRDLQSDGRRLWTFVATEPFVFRNDERPTIWD